MTDTFPPAEQDAATPRVRAVKEALVRKVHSGFWRPGERFLSARALAHRYGISYQTADRLLTELSDAGLLVRKPKSGTFLPGTVKELTGVALVFHARARRAESFGARLRNHLRAALRSVGGRQPITCWMESDLTGDMTAPPTRPAGRLPIVWNCPRLAHAWAEAGHRVLLVNDRPGPQAGAAGALIDSVGVDDLAGGALAADLLLRLTRQRAGDGSRRVMVITGPPDDRRGVERGEGFTLRWRSVADPGRKGWPRVHHAGGWLEEDGRLAATRALAAHADAVFCCNDRLAQGLVEAYRARRQAPPPLVGFDDAPIAEAIGLTTVAIPWRELAAAARQLAQRRLAEPNPTAAHDVAFRLLLTPQPVVRTLGFV